MTDVASDKLAQHHDTRRIRAVITGAVQGVGFRPFVYRAATMFQLTGHVQNSTRGLIIELQGSETQIQHFWRYFHDHHPKSARIYHIHIQTTQPTREHDFIIRTSEEQDEDRTFIMPDMATCAECVRELFDPRNRRFQYPFITCTQCGPRYTIIESLPYDRSRCTMKHFPLCEECRAEYDDPTDRRFHAETIACPRCGPEVQLWDARGRVVASGDTAWRLAVRKIVEGHIVAVKGLGGFHLLVDATNGKAVDLLRQRKGRPSKPFAVMFPNLAQVKSACEVSCLEQELLCSWQAPIVLLRRRRDVPDRICQRVAPGHPTYGVMLPYTPLHHLLLAEVRRPVIATSGNHSDEPICTEEHEAVERLAGVADWFLVHNRPIAHHADDSIVRVMGGRPVILRRARGYAPLPIDTATPLPNVLAVGAHSKNTIALTLGSRIIISPHIGDLDTFEACQTFQKVLSQFTQWYHHPRVIACDLHPDYYSTHFATKQRATTLPVPHHYAHALACMADHRLTGTALAVIWDGTGYGPDGTVWGGEFLRITEAGFERVGYLRPFPLPGGEKAVREPRRSALGLLFEAYGDRMETFSHLATLRSFSRSERRILCQIMRQRLQAPLTSSAGRLFDAVASILDVRQICDFEGQAAMELEFLAEASHSAADYGPQPFPFHWHGNQLDWAPTLHAIQQELTVGHSPAELSLRFHYTLIEFIISVTRSVNERRVLLTGGCFQNKLLLELAIERLHREGYVPYWHEHIPPNDGGLAVGQVLAAQRLMEV